LASYDVNNHDEDPMPRYDLIDSNRHGTRCAGEVAAEGNNSICAVGVAFDAGIGGTLRYTLIYRFSFPLSLFSIIPLRSLKKSEYAKWAPSVCFIQIYISTTHIQCSGGWWINK
jgi:hypothetical protein